MYNIVEKYMNSLNKEKVNEFAKSKNITLSNEELEFTYSFLKKNYKEMLKSNSLFDIDRYKGKYTSDNFNKIKKVYIEYYSKYKRFF